jgi:ketosteroid isomerase-like protein
MLVAVPAIGANCPSNQPKTEAALIELEHTWAKALQIHDANTVECLLDDNFEDADVHGNLHDRAEALAGIAKRRPGSNELSETHAHISGDAAFVRGLNTVKDANGNIVAKVRFTDIFVYRDGAWHAVAGQETLVDDKK